MLFTIEFVQAYIVCISQAPTVIGLNTFGGFFVFKNLPPVGYTLRMNTHFMSKPSTSKLCYSYYYVVVVDKGET